jgi:hypothetical protein
MINYVCCECLPYECEEEPQESDCCIDLPPATHRRMQKNNEFALIKHKRKQLLKAQTRSDCYRMRMISAQKNALPVPRRLRW